MHQKRREEESFVLLVDSIFEANPALVKKLELHLLSPLTELPNAAIILTGRGSVPVWETPELRVKTEEIIWLTKFEINVVTEQLTSSVKLYQSKTQKNRAFDSRRLNPLFQTSCCFSYIYSHKSPRAFRRHPLNNYFLTLEFAKHWGKNGITDSDIAASLDRLINLLLRDQQEKRDYFEALCVLEGFREWEVSTLLDIYLSTNTYP
ncbi:MAG: hypothetical protein R2867_22315 [Caldilineaceae bacterium]